MTDTQASQQKQPRESAPSTDAAVQAGTTSQRLPRAAVDRWINRTDLVGTHGVTMLEALDEEFVQLDKEGVDEGNEDGMAEYTEQLEYIYNTVANVLLSSAHRRIQTQHLHEGMDEGYRIPNELEEIDLCTESVLTDENEPDEPVERIPDRVDTKAAAQEALVKKKEDAKRRRLEDGLMLVKDKKVKDEKGNILDTVGPFPAPRLPVRSVVPDHRFPSRKSLNQKTTLTSSSATSAPQDEFVPKTEPRAADASYDASAHLREFFRPLSLESLKKVSESAKLNLRSASREEYLNHIVKGAARLGYEQACILMEKYKIIDAVASSCYATSPELMGTNIDFLQALPEHLREMLAPALGLPKEFNAVPIMWERIVSMGLCMVLANIRLRPLKRIVQELGIQLFEAASTEMHCQAIVYSVFPREVQRLKRNAKKKEEVGFSVKAGHSRTVGDMGFIVFTVHNVSVMRKDNERHYSPEFEFGALRWSLLCMANKDNLALYLCQTGSVHCKFTITVLNDNIDESICNEGTQRFNSASIENDWGFNTVMSFATLLDPAGGFWHSDTDSIDVEVGIVFVEQSSKPAPPRSTNQSKNAAHRTDARINETVANQLLELERLENVRKRLKNELNKLLKDEERGRKELHSRMQQTMSKVNENEASERHRIVNEAQERERREQQELKRRQERLRAAAEKAQEIELKIAELGQESTDLTTRKKKLNGELRDARKSIDRLKSELSSADDQVAASQTKLSAMEEKISSNETLLAALRQENQELEMEAEAAAQEELREAQMQAASAAPLADTEILEAVQLSLASILGDGK